MVAMIHRQYVAQNPSFIIAGVCDDGEKALHFIESAEVDLLILDVHMPRLSGMELLRRIRDRNYPTEVVMVTAANDVATFEEAFRLGVVDYLVKPFAYDRFQNALKKFLQKRGALEGVTALNQERIDDYLSGTRRVDETSTPKGVQEKTVRALVDFLENAPNEWLAGDAIAEQIKLSSVTVRRYMNHLVAVGVVEYRMDYETGGRPRLLYRIKKDQDGAISPFV